VRIRLVSPESGIVGPAHDLHELDEEIVLAACPALGGVACPHVATGAAVLDFGEGCLGAHFAILH
jgi:hypothetical protein